MRRLLLTDRLCVVRSGIGRCWVDARQRTRAAAVPANHVPPFLRRTPSNRTTPFNKPRFLGELLEHRSKTSCIVHDYHGYLNCLKYPQKYPLWTSRFALSFAFKNEQTRCQISITLDIFTWAQWLSIDGLRT